MQTCKEAIVCLFRSLSHYLHGMTEENSINVQLPLSVIRPKLDLGILCILLGISPASDCGLSTFRNPLSVPSSRAGCKV